MSFMDTISAGPCHTYLSMARLYPNTCSRAMHVQAERSAKMDNAVDTFNSTVYQCRVNTCAPSGLDQAQHQPHVHRCGAGLQKTLRALALELVAVQ